ncbi:MAG TPA: TonB-dependent receptor [Terriglobales bacterium]|nr:TonB-dependent receptor [Terriglobales bacterium]
MKRTTIKGLLAIVLTLAGNYVVHAQVVTANLQGVVSDPSGAVIADAAVTATNIDTGVQRNTTTNAEGFYGFNLLPRGQYEVRAAKVGFATEVLRVTLTVGGTVAANLVLRVAGRTEQVSVMSQAMLVETASSQIQEPVLQTQISNLPINDRNFQQLANLIPGAAPAPSYDPTKRLYGGVVSGGATARSSGVSVDGGNFNDNIVGGPVGLVPEDAIQEFQVITNQFSAEYGHSSGPFINVVTKSGTNEVHGSGFLLFRHNDLQARGFFEQTKPDFNREQFGGSLGGPIVKDKTFGFYAVERNRQQKTQTISTGGVFPQLEGSFPAPFRDLLMVAKFDHHFNAAHSLSFRSTFQRNTSREGLRVDPNISFGGPPTASAFQVATNENISWQMTDTWVMSSRTLNQFTVQFNRFINNLVPTSRGINLRFPSVVLGQNASTPQGVQQDRLQFRDDFSTMANWHGVHNLKFGTDLNPRIKYNGLFDLFKNGVFLFGQDDPTLQCFPDFSAPVSCITSIAPLFALKGLGSTKEDGTIVWQMAYYVQDDWKVNRRLTLNLGLRYEYESGFIDAGFHHPLEGRAPFFNSRTRETPKLSFGPRVGFAYDVLGSGRTVVRGAFGILYDSTPWENSYIDRTFDGVKYEFGVFAPSQPTLSDPAFSAPQIPGGFAIDGKVHQPYTEQYSIGLGQQLPYGIVLDASYVHILGLHGWMTRELNPQGTKPDGTVVPPPFPGLGLFSSFQTTNISHYNALQVSARKNLDRRVQFQLSYTLSKAVSLSDDIFEPGVPQDSNNIFADKGPTLRDARHRFVLSGIINLPWGFQTSNIVALQSGRPFNITTGSDDNGDGHLKDRPPGVGRNAGRAAPTYIWDARLSRPFKIKERVIISPTVDMFNVVNHPNFDAESYNGSLIAGCPVNVGPPTCGTLQAPGPGFGKPSDIISPPRQLQLGVRVSF